MKTNKQFSAKYIITLLLISLIALSLLAGCTGSNQSGPTAPNAAENTETITVDNAENADNENTDNEPTQAADSDTITIGVIQYGSHPSLDNCNQGIEEGLQASGINYTLDHQDGNFDSATCDSIAKNMVAKNYDIIFAIATPAATSAYAAAANSNVPVVFCAVSDPISAGLVDSAELPGGNCTGTCDLLDLRSQLELITSMQPDVQNIGVLYTTSETNSVSQLNELKQLAQSFGVTIIEQGVQSAADIPQAATTLVAKVDCINNFTDNNVVNNLNVLLEKATAAGIPVYGSEIEQVINGCLGAASIEYIALGKETANIGIRILAGEDASTIPVQNIAESTPVINTDVAAALGIEIPEAYKDAQFVTTGQE